MSARTVVGAIAIPLVLATACGSDESGDDADALTVYSGRTEELVGPIIEQFTEDTGIEVDVRYGNTAELAALILDEGDNSPADVFFGQDAGALGALSAAGVLAPLDQQSLDKVAERFRSPEDEWVGTSGRARVVAYNTDVLTEDELPDAIAEFTDPQWSGRIGWAPTNASFQAFVTALRVLEGEDAARAWLEAMEANDTQVYENNIATVDAVAAGEIDAGLVNHYYLYPKLAEDPNLPVANKFYSDGDPGALVNVAGTAVLDTSDRTEEAGEFVEYLLSEEGQTFFAEETSEYPLVEGIEPAANLPELSSLTPPELDLSRLDDLDGTLALLQETGVL